MAAGTAISTKILEFLRNASSPKKANEVAEHLSITKKEANSHLYRMAKTKMVKRNSNSLYWEVNCDLEDCQETPAPADTISTKILEFLRKSSSPKKANEVAEHLSITKKEANSHLYTMKKAKMVKRRDSTPVYWEVNCDLEDCQETPAPADTVRALVPVACRELYKTPSSSLTAVTGLTEFDQRILSCIEENGGRLTALSVAKGVGNGTVKEVNSMLYSLKDKGQLIHDQTNKLWIIKGKEEMATTGCTVNNFRCIIQNNPINCIYQQGESNTVNISESQNTQVGSGNIIHNPTEHDQRLPSLSYPGCDTAKVPVHSEIRAEMAGVSPETMSSHVPRQEVNINKSTLRHSMIGSNNTMLVRCEREGTEKTEENMADEETGARLNSGFDSESLSDNDGPSSEKEESACMTTRTLRTAQSINIRDSHIKNSVIGHDTRECIDDKLEDFVSILFPQTQMLRIENGCKLDQTLPRLCGEISIKSSHAQYINLGNDNYMNIETLQESPESTGSKEEAEEEEDESPNQLGPV